MKPGARILVIDDDAVFAGVLARSLERRGFVAASASSGVEAQAKLASFEPEHAVLDLKLGADNGLVVLRQLLEARPGLRVLLLTGYASLATAVEAIKLGAINYIAKPVDARAVIAALDDQADEADTELEPPERPTSLARLAWEHIQRVLAEHDGNVAATARALGMHRRTLQRKLAKRPVAE